MKICEVGEFGLIRLLQEENLAPGVIVGIGDDAAVVQPTPNCVTLLTTDMLVEGVHFILTTTDAWSLGWKAMAANLSDIAAMGGKPKAAFVSVALPRDGGEAIGRELYRGMREMADQFDTPIAGGDTNSWAYGLVISVTLLGEPGPQGPILRRGAKPGDWLLVTGPLGGSILGKHLDFTPRIREGLLLQDHARLHAMIDISDGLSADAFHICEESSCGAVLFAERVLVSDAALQMNDEKTGLEHALSDGEDFELAFAVDPADGERLTTTQPIPGVTLSCVGEFVAEAGLFLEENGVRRAIEPRGYAHAFR